MKVRSEVSIILSPEDLSNITKLINLHYLKHENCNEFKDGKYISKYPELETKEFLDASYNIHKTFSNYVEVEFSEITGCPINWRFINECR
jgi:hypothetical protein